MKKNLIFLTSMFPFGKGETFIENEFPFLEKKFEKIIIITNHSLEAENRLSENKKVHVYHFPYELTKKEKNKSLLKIFNLTFWQEIFILLFQYKIKITPIILKTILSSLQKGSKFHPFLQKILKENNCALYETILYSYWMNDMAICAASITYKNPSLKFVTRTHRWDLYFDIHPSNYLPFRTFILKNCTKCFSISEHGVNYLNQLTKNKFSDKIKLARLGTLPYQSKELSLLEKRTKQLQLVSCSNMIPVKCVHLIINALSELNTSLDWVHFGSGPLCEQLKYEAHERLGSSPNIHYRFYGQISNPDLMEYYSTHSVDLFINVSESEGVPVSIMEAMSFGIPCIATNVGGTSEIVTNKNGVLLSPNPTVEEIQNAITSIINLSEIDYSKKRENAFETWNEKYNAERSYREFCHSLRYAAHSE